MAESNDNRGKGGKEEGVKVEVEVEVCRKGGAVEMWVSRDAGEVPPVLSVSCSLGMLVGKKGNNTTAISA